MSLTVKNSSAAKIQDISQHGIWILVGQQEFFMPFTEFPWFLKATLGQMYHVEFLHEHHLYWPDLDIDIDVDPLRHPDKYPLTYSVTPLNQAFDKSPPHI
jgi:hypothetical protein